MSETSNEALRTEQFYTEVKKNVKEDMEYRDAVQLVAVMMGVEIARLCFSCN